MTKLVSTQYLANLLTDANQRTNELVDGLDSKQIIGPKTGSASRAQKHQDVGHRPAVGHGPARRRPPKPPSDLVLASAGQAEPCWPAGQELIN